MSPARDRSLAKPVPAAEVIDLRAARAARQRQAARPDETLEQIRAHQLRALKRAHAWADFALAAGTRKAYRGAARRVREIYMREFRHPNLVALVRLLRAKANDRRDA